MNGGVVSGEELNLPSAFPSVPEVTVCGCESLFVQVTVSPTLACIGFGENASLLFVDAPETMDALTVLPPPVDVVLPLVWLPVLVEFVLLVLFVVGDVRVSFELAWLV